MQARIRLLLIHLVNILSSGHHATAGSSVSDRLRISNATPTATTCEARTVNYITHTLPQFCLTSAWSNSASLPIEAADPPFLSEDALPHSMSEQADTARPTDRGNSPRDTGSDSPPTPFMSFEDWKEMMLRQTGQDPQEIRERQVKHYQADDGAPADMGHDGLGEEDEINLNFESYLDTMEEKRDSITDTSTHFVGRDDTEQAVIYEDGRPSIHRSKDAGKTCKERFSYSSFDAGATVLKTSQGAKNAKAILVENKDSYMLLECSAESKFVIVELSDDILIDTVVLANFEFFSSMIRRFRVTVSDRYPVKSERWRELGYFEARNSRDIQPFLVENPQIWAKYVRIEFLTHYGNEYYCPVSLLRIHGSRMLDSWKDSESGRDEEGHIEDETESVGNNAQTMELQQIQKTEALERTKGAEVLADSPVQGQSPNFTPPDLFKLQDSTCEGSFTAHAEATALLSNSSAKDSSTDKKGSPVKQDRFPDNQDASAAPAVSRSSMQQNKASEDVPITTTSTHWNSPNLEASNSTSRAPGGSTASLSDLHAASDPPVTRQSTSSPSGGKNRTTATTTSVAASPTIQEGFFKAITKRLQQVESNLTLSLKYVEDQARHLQDTLQRTEHKQLSKVSLFLDTLNQTVLAELRSVREQYDEIWQSTVIALDSQREQSEREIVALSTRLNFLADEVIFQKRMAIVQAVLLLSCLLLVIFSRGVTIPSLGPFTDQAIQTSLEATMPSSQDSGVLFRPGLPPSRPRPSAIDVTPGVDYVQDFRSDHHLTYSDSLSDDPPDTPEHRQQISPPLTPGLPDLSMMADAAPVPTTTDANHARCVSAQHQQQIAVRKPLPALPENPSSP